MSEPKKPASEQDLAVLHSLQAKVFISLLTTVLAGLEDPDPDVRMAAAMTVNPSIMNAINGFLKNNDITCDPTVLADLTAAEKAISARRNLKMPELPSLDSLELDHGVN